MMTRHFLFGFLLGTFVLHGIAFTVLGIVRKKRYLFFLTGTFTFLSGVYYLKFREFFPNIPGMAVSAVVVLRICAIACTLTYLATIYRIEGTWLNRLLRKG